VVAVAEQKPRISDLLPSREDVEATMAKLREGL
jgi:hypothetical protein